MDSSLSRRAFAAARTTDRKTVHTRDTAALTPRTSRLPFRPRWLLSPSPSEPSFVWDIPNPFASPLPRPADNVQARIDRERRYESVGPLDQVNSDLTDPEYDSDDYDDVDHNEERCDSDDFDGFDDNEQSYDNNDGDADDEDECDSDADTDDDRPLMPIAFPQSLHNFPLRFITPSIAPSVQSEVETRVPSPPTLLLYPSSESETERNGEHPDKDESSWADLATVYNDIAEAEERATRKAKRDAHRSRLKVLAILGPEASSAF